MRLDTRAKLQKHLLKRGVCCYGPSVISVTVTKGGHLSGSRLYKTSEIIGRGVTKLRNYIYQTYSRTERARLSI